MPSFSQTLRDELDHIGRAGLARALRLIDGPQSPHLQVEGRSFLNFSSNDYLGLANNEVLKEAARVAVDMYGSGAGSARLISGTLPPHQELEEEIASFQGTDGALTFSSGYAAALGVLCALMGRVDTIILDRLSHASLVDGARFCGAKLRVFAHNNLNDLERILRWCDQRSQGPVTHDVSGQGNGPVVVRRHRVLIVTESVFSMEGDHAPLQDIVELKERYGAWLLLDEAHATGLYGENRTGRAEGCAVASQIEIRMGTLGKAFGAAGGYVCGSRALIDYLINRARTFMFSTAPVPAAAGAAAAGIRLVRSSEGERRRRLLWQRVEEVRKHLEEGGWNFGKERSAIMPMMIGSEREALNLAGHLHENGIYLPAIRYPTVGKGKARLRSTVSSAHTSEDVERLGRVLKAIRHV